MGLAVWFTGLSGAGKTTLCRALEPELRSIGYPVQILDGDEIRQHLSRDLGFSKADRDENVRRIGFVTEMLVRQNVIVLVAALLGELRYVTGIEDPYEPPLQPDLECNTDEESCEESKSKVLAAIRHVQQGRCFT